MKFEMQVGGLSEISEALEKLAEDAPKAAAQGLYDGAAVMVDEVRKSIEEIRTEPFHYSVFPGTTTRLPTPEEKEIVMKASAGIAKFDKDGTEINTSVGFRNAGYAQLKGKTVPIPVIVNAINSGTSFMKKQPFFRKAASMTTPKAVQAMKNTIETAWSKIYNEVMDKYGGR